MKFYIDEDAENIKDYLLGNNGESEWLKAIQQAKNSDDIEDLKSELEDYLYTEDAITGNGSGSYYFNSSKAKKTVLANIEEVVKAYKDDYDLDLEEDLAENNWEKMDVVARCYYLHEAVNNFIKSYILTLAINNKDAKIYGNAELYKE